MEEQKRTMRESVGLIWWVVGLGVFVAVVFSSLIIWEQGRQRELVVERALLSSQNLALALEEHTRAIIQASDAAVIETVEYVEEALAKGGVNSLAFYDELREVVDRIPQISGMI